MILHVDMEPRTVRAVVEMDCDKDQLRPYSDNMARIKDICVKV